MIETVVQAPGRFEVKLNDPPELIKQGMARPYSLFVVTPTPVDATGITVSGIDAIASYVGIVKGRGRDRRSISGYGPAILLTGARQQKDQKVSKRPLYDGSNTSWIRNNVLRLGVSENNGITVGTITSSATPTKKGAIKAGQTPLEVLNEVCRRFSVSWRVNPTGTLDVGSRATLWPTTTTPTAIATPLAAGRDAALKGLPDVVMDEAEDWDDYTTEVVVPYVADDYEFGVSYAVGDTVVATDGTYYKCASAHTSSGANLPPNATYWTEVEPYGLATTSSSYLILLTGQAPVERRVVEGRNVVDDDDADTVASQQLTKWGGTQQELTISSSSWAITDEVKAGDSIWVYDPENGLYDTANSVDFRGQSINPTKVRVRAVRDACSEGKGYYLISWTGSSAQFDDLTPYVAYEDPGVTLECGSPRRLRPGAGLVSPGFRGWGTSD